MGNRFTCWSARGHSDAASYSFLLQVRIAFLNRSTAGSFVTNSRVVVPRPADDAGYLLVYDWLRLRRHASFLHRGC